MRSKAIGTAAETAVVRYLIANGWPNAERRALRGVKDVGDITGTPGLVWEVKGGEAARNASDTQIANWLAETELERHNDGAAVGLLVVARERKNVRDWWAIMWADHLTWLIGTAPVAQDHPACTTPVRMTLAHAVDILRVAGWGDSA